MSQQATPTPNPTTPPTIAPPVDADAAAQKPEELPLHQLRHSGDWRKGKSYPLPGSRNYQVWAWEFLRRNAEYGAFALWCCQSLPKELLTRQSPKSKDLIQHLICGFDAPATVTMYGEYKQWCKTENQPCLAVTPNQYLRTRWGITHPLLPLQSFPTKKKQKAEHKNPPKFLSNSISYFLPTWGKEFEPMALHEINFLGTNGIRSKIAANEALIRFRLGEPIKKQIERANVFLDKWQRRYLTAKHSGKPPTSIKPDIPTPDRDLPSRTDVVALHYMLRILDAAHDPLIRRP